MWELTLEDVNLADEEEKENYAMLPQIQQAIDIMLSNTATIPTVTAAEGIANVTHTDQVPAIPEVDLSRMNGIAQGLGVGGDAIPKNSVEPKALAGMDETVEAAALDNRNFIRVIIGGERYLAQLDPGATISLVGHRI